jgi:hypothetical protein
LGLFQSRKITGTKSTCCLSDILAQLKEKHTHTHTNQKWPEKEDLKLWADENRSYQLLGIL